MPDDCEDVYNFVKKEVIALRKFAKDHKEILDIYKRSKSSKEEDIGILDRISIKNLKALNAFVKEVIENLTELNLSTKFVIKRWVEINHEHATITGKIIDGITNIASRLLTGKPMPHGLEKTTYLPLCSFTFLKKSSAILSNFGVPFNGRQLHPSGLGFSCLAASRS